MCVFFGIRQGNYYLALCFLCAWIEYLNTPCNPVECTLCRWYEDRYGYGYGYWYGHGHGRLVHAHGQWDIDWHWYGHYCMRWFDVVQIWGTRKKHENNRLLCPRHRLPQKRTQLSHQSGSERLWPVGNIRSPCSDRTACMIQSCAWTVLLAGCSHHGSVVPSLFASMRQAWSQRWTAWNIKFLESVLWQVDCLAINGAYKSLGKHFGGWRYILLLCLEWYWCKTGCAIDRLLWELFGHLCNHGSCCLCTQWCRLASKRFIFCKRIKNLAK